MLAHLLCGLRMKLDEPEARSARSAAVGSAFQFLCFYRRGERVRLGEEKDQRHRIGKKEKDH